VSDIFSYSGKRVAIVGCFSGMGEACARELVSLGAEVHGFDIKPSPVDLASFTPVDLKDWAAIDSTVADFKGEIDGLFNCAGLPNNLPAVDIVRVNFLGIRHWTEAWLPKVRRGSGIVSISSLGGMGYLQRQPLLQAYIAITGEQEAIDWLDAHAEDVGDGYGFSKELLNTWTHIAAFELAPMGIRVNATMPSSTQTPMMNELQKAAPLAVFEAFSQPVGRYATPAEQGDPLVFLNSDAARFVSGVCLPVDGGFFGGVLSGIIDPQKLVADALAAA
jgi:NAD(P)-dependent dehydrogenase (short-subunit alcohol dehydrogenase family)